MELEEEAEEEEGPFIVETLLFSLISRNFPVWLALETLEGAHPAP